MSTEILIIALKEKGFTDTQILDILIIVKGIYKTANLLFGEK